MSSNAQEGVSNQHLFRRYAPCVERTGLGDAFRKRVQQDRISHQNPGTLSTTASGNGVYDNGVLNSGKNAGVVSTGLSGARSEQSNQFIYYHNHFGGGDFHASTSLATNNTSEHIVGHSCEQLSGSSSTTSREYIGSVTKTQVEAQTSSRWATKTKTPNNGPRVPRIHLPESAQAGSDQTGSSSDSEDDSATEEVSIEDCISRIDSRGTIVIAAFEEIFNLLPSHVRRQQDVLELWKFVKQQQCLFANYHTSLSGAIRHVASQPSQSMFLSGTCNDVLETLENLQKVLGVPKEFIKRMSKRKPREVTDVGISIYHPIDTIVNFQLGC
ncbi:uncharacterized protein BDZ83DRAFT_658377 [Colletotrichum acutatum]|uniref:Uncharacterized protein n=1 Tax=Glomerella acutata TaxID=27357 RepID=A0AAD8U9A8_GLOAC|nr:uncharacterized protein BDZ83DRAFT_658377 [Colletotrichum acutatum]KAK1703434.1 hypothetical protein BDZ83DRAFT_658377 [Colletotrichum acutatum]